VSGEGRAAALKARTRRIHRATERAPLARAMARGTISRDAYGAYLVGMRALLGALEAKLARSTDPRIAAVRAGLAPHTPRLDVDLLALGRPTAPPALHAAVTRAAAALDAEDALGLLGWIYVLEGSGLGGVVLAPRVARGVGLTEDAPGLSYLRGDPDLYPRFGRFRATLDAVTTDADTNALVAAAHRAFDAVRTMFDALTVVDRESLTSSPPALGAHGA